jgi:hypothetical protein
MFKNILIAILVVVVLLLILQHTTILNKLGLNEIKPYEITSALILLFTALIVFDYTKATKQQKDVMIDQYEFQMLPSISHSLQIAYPVLPGYISKTYDLQHIYLTIYNHCRFEVYTKVYLDILYDGIPLGFRKDGDESAYQGRLLWAIQPHSQYTGYIDFGRWFIDKCANWESCYGNKVCPTPKDLEAKIQFVNDRYVGGIVTFKIRLRSISAFGYPYFSNTYSYTYSFKDYIDDEDLIPQQVVLEKSEMYDKNGKPKVEYLFPDIPNCEWPEE